MPRRVTARACIFKCGRRVLTSRQKMADHERTCFSNPERRACRTCRHEDRNDHGDPECWDPNGPGEENGWIDDPAWLSARDPNQVDFHGSTPKERGCRWPPRIRWSCPGWEPKSA